MCILIGSAVIAGFCVYNHKLYNRIKSLETRIDAIEHLTDRIVDTTSHGEQSQTT
jgi:hypothetical protein